MNIFLAYENDIKKSIEVLDDRRLNKQILEVYQLLSNSLKESEGEEIKGYKHHPVYIHYKDDVEFLLYYGLRACDEFEYRFGKRHSLKNRFADILIDWTFEDFRYENFVPFYAEGKSGRDNYIRTTENVSALFQEKLKNKWQSDYREGRPPKWTGRKTPEFYRV